MARLRKVVHSISFYGPFYYHLVLWEALLALISRLSQAAGHHPVFEKIEPSIADEAKEHCTPVCRV